MTKQGTAAIVLQDDLVSDLVHPRDAVNALDASYVKTIQFSFSLYVPRESFAAMKKST